MILVINHLDRIEKKVDGLDGRLDGFEKIQVKQEANLVEHMRRSDLLEKHQNLLRESVSPVMNVYTIAWGLCKIILGLSVVIGILSLLKVF